MITISNRYSSVHIKLANNLCGLRQLKNLITFKWVFCYQISNYGIICNNFSMQVYSGKRISFHIFNDPWLYFIRTMRIIHGCAYTASR